MVSTSSNQKHPVYKVPKSIREAISRPEDPDSKRLTCLVCASSMNCVGIGPCGHQIVCALCHARLRVKEKDRNCVLCKEDLDFVLVHPAEPHDQMDYSEILGKTTKIIGSSGRNKFVPGYIFDNTSGLLFVDSDIGRKEFQRITLMYKFSCPFEDCEAFEDKAQFSTAKAFNTHLLNHKKRVCQICFYSSKKFPRELPLYSENEHAKHVNKGNPLEDGTQGHPKCHFCSKAGKKTSRFYDNDQLYVHLKKTHEFCHVCKRADPSDDTFYFGRRELFAHFKESHYICDHPDCVDSFQAFGSVIELQAHTFKKHRGALVDRNVVGNFQFRQPGSQNVRLTLDNEDEPLVAPPALEVSAFQYLPGQTRGENGEVLAASSVQQPLQQSSGTNTPRWNTVSGGRVGINREEAFPALGGGSSSNRVSSSTKNRNAYSSRLVRPKLPSNSISMVNQKERQSGWEIARNHKRRDKPKIREFPIQREAALEPLRGSWSKPSTKIEGTNPEIKAESSNNSVNMADHSLSNSTENGSFQTPRPRAKVSANLTNAAPSDFPSLRPSASAFSSKPKLKVSDAEAWKKTNGDAKKAGPIKLVKASKKAPRTKATKKLNSVLSSLF